MFCLGLTVVCRIGDPCKMRHLAAKSADSMLLNLPHCTRYILYVVCTSDQGQLAITLAVLAQIHL
jgi:hypothetical protein